MARAARVTSLDALRDFKAGLVEFTDEARRAVVDAEQDASRTLAWLQSDALPYWQAEIKRRTERVNQARMELSQKRFATEQSGGSVVDERKALRRAEERLDEARQKLERTRHWIRELDREAMLFKGQLQQLMAALDQDMPNATSLMNRLIESVEAYITEQAPAQEPYAETTGSAARDDVASTASAGPRMQPRDQQRYVALREFVPDPSTRRRLRMADQSEAMDPGDRLGDEDVAAIDQLPGDRHDPDPRARIVLEIGALAADRWAMLRLAPSTNGDSGWVVISADRDEPPDADVLQSISVLRLVDQRPDLRGILRLAEHTLVVVGGDRLLAVFNGRDEAVWPP